MATVPTTPANAAGINSGRISFTLITARGGKETNILNDANVSAESFEFTLTII
jgi:hypothetical protein